MTKIFENPGPEFPNPHGMTHRRDRIITGCVWFVSRLSELSPLWNPSMAQAIVDPGELRRFAHALKIFNGDLRANLSSLHSQLLALSDTWRDQEHERFVQEYEETMGVLEKFLDISDEHVPFLTRKAERIEEYMQQR